MARKNRIFVVVPDALAKKASGLAEKAGHSLTPYLHAYVVSAVRAALTGRGELPAASRHPVPLVPDADGNRPNPSKVAIVASAKDRDAWTAALESRGSSIGAVVVEALDAFITAEGSWVKTVMPSESDRSWHGAGAA